VQYNVLLWGFNPKICQTRYKHWCNGVDYMLWGLERCWTYQHTKTMPRNQGSAVQCTALWFQPLNPQNVIQRLMLWCRFHEMKFRTWLNVPAYYKNAQNSSLCSTTYCFGVFTRKSGTTPTNRWHNGVDCMKWGSEQCWTYQHTTRMLRIQACAVQCTALWFQPSNPPKVMQSLI
jgi:predicted metal-dependent enzyme (double-stranded beta helix superfamily)